MPSCRICEKPIPENRAKWDRPVVTCSRECSTAWRRMIQENWSGHKKPCRLCGCECWARSDLCKKCLDSLQPWEKGRGVWVCCLKSRRTYRLPGKLTAEKDPSRSNCTCEPCRAERREKWKQRAMETCRRLARESYHRNKHRPERVVHGAVRFRIIDAIKKRTISATKNAPTFTMLGYSKADLVAHIQNQFEFGMTWGNYGTEWHIDHVVPVSWFRGVRREVVKKCWALKNLKPRWKTNEIANKYGGFMEGNLEKSNRYAG